MTVIYIPFNASSAHRDEAESNTGERVNKENNILL